MNTESFIAQVYSAFNHRNIDGALAFMSESVSWPKASEGGRVVGKQVRLGSPSSADFKIPKLVVSGLEASG